jgi:hypothetical protein
MDGEGPTCSMQTAHNDIRTIRCWDKMSSYPRGRSSKGSFGAEWCHCEGPEARERLYDERVYDGLFDWKGYSTGKITLETWEGSEEDKA